MSTIDLSDVASQPVDQVFAELDSTPSGLTTSASAHRLTEFGHNVLVEHRVTVGRVLWRQLRNPLLILLAGAATVSGATGDPTDAIIIGLILALSVGLGFTNEYRSELAAIASHSSIQHQTVAWRDGTRETIDVADLVPGDVVELSVGAIAPADLSSSMRSGSNAMRRCSPENLRPPPSPSPRWLSVARLPSLRQSRSLAPSFIRAQRRRRGRHGRADGVRGCRTSASGGVPVAAEGNRGITVDCVSGHAQLNTVGRGALDVGDRDGDVAVTPEMPVLQ